MTEPPVIVLPGDPAPWFNQKTTSNPNYVFSSAAGRYVVLGFFASGQTAEGGAALTFIQKNAGRFDDRKFSFFGVTVDPRDEANPLAAERIPGIRFFHDFDFQVSRLYGAATAIGDQMQMRLFWLVLDPTLRVLARVNFTPDRSDQTELLAILERLPPPASFPGFEVSAPILVLPNVFEPQFCEELIQRYETHGGEESGFMREVDGKTVLAHDPGHKKRKDHIIEDEGVIGRTQSLVKRRIVPEIQKVHQFKVTRMERYIVSCYAAEDGGHFAPHRDNTTKGTAHRRFAVSINLNADFDGGEISFPEYGPRSYKAPPGGAVVFSCSLLHTVSPVTRGRRYAFLPFLYDDEAAKIRAANNRFLGDGVGEYHAEAS